MVYFVFNDSLCAALIPGEPGGCYLGSAAGMWFLQFLGFLAEPAKIKCCTKSTLMLLGLSRRAVFGTEGSNEGNVETSTHDYSFLAGN